MAMHPLTRQSKIRHSASGGKCLPAFANLFSMFRMSPCLAYSMNRSPCALMRLFAIVCCSIDRSLVVRGGNLWWNKKACAMCGARTNVCRSR